MRRRFEKLLLLLAFGGCDQVSLVSLPASESAAVACEASASECGGVCVWLLDDPQNCGECGLPCKTGEGCRKGVCREEGCSVPSACPKPLHSPATCVEGHCGRGPCDPGFFDFDGPAQPGCEASCVGRRCTVGDGGTLVLGSEPLPEAGLVFGALSSGSSFGAQVQTNSEFTHFGILGEPTPSAIGGGVEQTSPEFRNLAGFGSIQSTQGGR